MQKKTDNTEFIQLLYDHSFFTNVLLHKVKSYFNDPKHRLDFEKWYQQKYGTPYVWNDPISER